MRMLMTRFINCSSSNSRWAAFEFFAVDQRLGKRDDDVVVIQLCQIL
jgi:hypothetical protein